MQVLIGYDEGMTALQTPADLDEAKSQPRALIFIWVDWSIQARQSEIAVRELIDLWQSAHGDYPMIAYRIDLSSLCPQLFARAQLLMLHVQLIY